MTITEAALPIVVDTMGGWVGRSGIRLQSNYAKRRCRFAQLYENKSARVEQAVITFVSAGRTPTAQAQSFKCDNQQTSRGRKCRGFLWKYVTFCI